MRSNAAAQPWRASLARAAIFRAAGLSIFGLFGWLWLFSEDGPAGRALSLVAVLALAALGGVAWYLPRARAQRQWRAALGRYAEQEQAKGAYPGSEATEVIDTDDIRDAALRRDIRPEDLAAELTQAAFPLVLRRNPEGSSVSVELGLWRALARTFKEWARDRTRPAPSKQVRAEEGLLDELTERACSVAVEHGVEGPLPVLKSCLYLAFRSVIFAPAGGMPPATWPVRSPAGG